MNKDTCRELVNDLPAEKLKRAEARVDQLERALEAIDHMLRIPAAEYVPAIGDVFTIIDKCKAQGAMSARRVKELTSTDAVKASVNKTPYRSA
jgi:hypothetical protein